MPGAKTVVEAAGREVTVSNPDKVFFPRTGYTKIDLVRYYLAVADGAVRGVARRPMALKRFVNGAEGEPFFQKRAPESRPDWIETVELRFPSGRTASEVVASDAAQLAWVVNLGCIDLNPHPVRADDLDHPDELRVDLDPVPGVEWPQIMDVAMVAKSVLEDFGLTAWPKTSGSRGFHIYARIEPRWPFTDVRRAAVALAREVERRAPDIATSKWWKEERHGVFVDYNQNAKDRTVASAYSIRPLPDARVSTPLLWDEVAGCDPAAFTIATVPARFAETGDPWAGMDDAVGSLGGADRTGRAGRGRGSARRPVATAFRPPVRGGAARPAVQAPDGTEGARQGRPFRGRRRRRTSGGRGGKRGRNGRRGRDGRRRIRGAFPARRADRAAAVHDATDRGGPRGHEDRGHGGPGTLEGAAPGCLAAAGSRRRAGGLDARAQLQLDKDPAEPSARPRSGTPAPGTSRSRLRPLGPRRALTRRIPAPVYPARLRVRIAR